MVVPLAWIQTVEPADDLWPVALCVGDHDGPLSGLLS